MSEPFTILVLENADTPNPVWPEVRQWCVKNKGDAEAVCFRDAFVDWQKAELSGRDRPWVDNDLADKAAVGRFLARFSVVVVSTRLRGPLRHRSRDIDTGLQIPLDDAADLASAIARNFASAGMEAPGSQLQQHLAGTFFQAGNAAFGGVAFMHAYARELSLANLVIVLCESDASWPVEEELLVPFTSKGIPGRLPATWPVSRRSGPHEVISILELAATAHRHHATHLPNFPRLVEACRNRNAVVISGPKGTGKRTLASALAAASHVACGNSSGAIAQLEALPVKPGTRIRVSKEDVEVEFGDDAFGIPHEPGEEIWLCSRWAQRDLDRLWKTMRPASSKLAAVKLICATMPSETRKIADMLGSTGNNKQPHHFALSGWAGDAAAQCAVRLVAARRLDENRWRWSDLGLQQFAEEATRREWPGYRELLELIQFNESINRYQPVAKFVAAGSHVDHIQPIEEPRKIYDRTLRNLHAHWSALPKGAWADGLPPPQTPGWHGTVFDRLKSLRSVEAFTDYVKFLKSLKQFRKSKSDGARGYAAIAAVAHFLGEPAWDGAAGDFMTVAARQRQQLAAVRSAAEGKYRKR